MSLYKLNLITNKNIWNDFIINSGFKFYSFVNSWEWWELQILEWNEIFRYGIYEKSSNEMDKCGELIWTFLLIKIKAKRATYFFTPHWPLIKTSPLTPLLWEERGIENPPIIPLIKGDENSKDVSMKNLELKKFQILKEILPELKQIARENKCSFIRLNSVFENNLLNKKKFEKLGFIDAPMHVHAEDTHLLDLAPNEETLLWNMDKWDRYYINRAKKEWVEIKIDSSEEQIKALIEMHQNHSHRNNWKNTYSAFSENYIRNLYKVFWENISTVSASYNWKIESILMTIKFWEVVVYYIAASDIVSNKFSPNYLCQWEAIINAKNFWAKIYNFWGISPDENPAHPIAWVTKFKRKFAWFDYSLLHAQDLVVSPKYRLNYLLETFRRKKRGYYYKKPV